MNTTERVRDEGLGTRWEGGEGEISVSVTVISVSVAVISVSVTVSRRNQGKHVQAGLCSIGKTPVSP